MALVLGLRVGQVFYADAERFELTRLLQGNAFELSRPSTGERFVITSDESVEVCPDVCVSAGEAQQRGVARLAIEAPREIRLTRGERLAPTEL